METKVKTPQDPDELKGAVEGDGKKDNVSHATTTTLGTQLDNGAEPNEERNQPEEGSTTLTRPN